MSDAADATGAAGVPAGAPAGAPGPAAVNTNGVLLWPVVAVVLVADLATKALAEAILGPFGPTRPLLGGLLQFNLVYNPGAAFGLSLGPYSRGIFLVLTAVILRVLWALYRATPDRHNARVAAIALLAGGAAGNAVDRVRSPLGVVDFLRVGPGPHFNLADVAVTAGAALLFAALWREERRGARDARGARGAASPAEVA